MKARILAFVFLITGPVAFCAALPPISNLIIHLKADSITGLSEGDFVEEWIDASGTADGVDGTVSAFDEQGTPVWHAFSANAWPAVEFSNDLLSTVNTFSLPNYSGGMTIFAVFTGDGSGTDSTRMAQVGSALGTNGQVLGLDSSISTASTGGSGFRFNNGSALVKASNPLNTNFHLGIWKMAQGAQHQAATFYVNSFTPQPLEFSNPTRTVTLPSDGNIFTLGTGVNNSADWITGDFYSGQIAEILIYNRQLTSTEMSDIVNYLYPKYFLSVISASPGLISLPEGQSSAVAITLNQQPTADVTVSVIGTPNQLTAAPATLVFTSGDWDQPQQIQITAIDDILLEPQYHIAAVALTAVSSDPVYNDARKAVNVTIVENECGLWAYPPGDMNEDCHVNIDDLAVLSFHWLWCDPMMDDLCFNLK